MAHKTENIDLFVYICSRYKRIGGLNFTVLVEPGKENTTALLYRYRTPLLFSLGTQKPHNSSQQVPKHQD
jgi:hypothetical protein